MSSNLVGVSPPTISHARQMSWRNRVWQARWCYLYMLPTLVLATFFTFYPIVASWYIALLDWSGFTQQRTFVGLANFTELVNDPFFWGAFGRSFLFMIVTVPIRLSLALIVAILLNHAALKLAPVFRTLFFIPVVTTTAIVGIVMTFVLSPLGGPVNRILVMLSMVERPIDFLGNPDSALWTVMAVSVWKFFGISLIYWLAALQVIPTELYEAGKLDGAGWWGLLRHITLPLIVPFAVIIILITAVNTLRVFDLVQTMTAGGPYFASEVVEIYIYRNAFSMQGGIPRLGYASAAGTFFGVAVMLLALGQAWAIRQMRAVRQDLSVGGG